MRGTCALCRQTAEVSQLSGRLFTAEEMRRVDNKYYCTEKKHNHTRERYGYDHFQSCDDIVGAVVSDQLWKQKEIADAQAAQDAILAEEQAKEDARLAKQEEKETERYLKMRSNAEGEHRKFLTEEMQREREEQAFVQLIAPKPIPPTLRYSHTHILAPSGYGKTVLLQHIILSDFWDEAQNKLLDPPAYVIIDPKGLMVNRLSRLNIFTNHLKDRLVIVDPLDRPALNMFDARGQNPAQVISNFSYIFSTNRQVLTGKQDPCFAFCAELLFRMPGSDLYTLLDLLDDRTDRNKTADPRFATAIASLNHPDDRALRRFFERDYYSGSYESTRQEIKTRLQPILRNNDISAMLNASMCKLDIADCIRNRKIVLVNTRMADMPDTHQIVGRFIISLFIQAMQARTKEHQSTWHPAFLMIDEFQEFADENKTPRMLRLIREYNAGAIIAHQNMHCDELTENMRNAISTNTSIKYASSPRGDDIRMMARDLQCDPDFLTKRCVKNADDSVFRFGCYFTGLQHPLLKEFRHDISRWPVMTDMNHDTLRLRNKQSLHAPPVTHKAPDKEASVAKRADIAPAERSSPAKKEDPPIVSPPKMPAQLPPNVVGVDNLKKDRDPGEPSDSWG
jgi:hypothetical protein